MAKLSEYPSYELLHFVFEIADDGCTLMWKNPKSKRYRGKRVAITWTKKGYARIVLHGRGLFLHRVLWKMRYGQDAPGFIDHINRNKADNSEENLRISYDNGNWRNTTRSGGVSRFRGVYAGKRKGTWGARIKVNGKTKHLGTFEKEIEAALCYDKAAKEHHGVFCSTNSGLGLC